MDKLKRILCVALLLLTVVAVYGCEKDDATEAVPAVYWCMDTELPAAEADGSYVLDFICDGKQVSYRCADATLAETICLQSVMGLMLEGDTVTGVRFLHDMPQTLFAWNYYVKSMGGGKVKVNSEESMNGDERMFAMTEQTKVYLVSALADTPGEETELLKYDGVTVLTNKNGEAETIFVSNRSYKEDAEATYCPHCEKDVIWSAWLSDQTVPFGAGHYRLEKDITLKKSFGLGGGKMCLDLNGKRIEQTTPGKRIYSVNGGMEFSIMDSVGSAVIRTSTAEPNAGASNTSGMAIGLYNSDAILNLYGGTFDGAGNRCQWAGVIEVKNGTFNMYEGTTILSANPWSTGSGGVCVEGTFNMYGGKIVGGRMVEGPSYSPNPRGGAVVYVKGIMNMYGGSIEGGYCEYQGGILYGLSGSVNLMGGTITGGESTQAGSGVYMAGGKLTLDGSINVIGNEGDNICMASGTTLILGNNLEDVKAGISMVAPGVLGDCYIDALPEGLFSDDPAHKLVIRDGKLVLE